MDNHMFEWDPEKNALNQKKHGIPFEIAIKVFQDPYLIDWYDEEHSGINEYGVWEDRYIAIGYIGDIIYVVYTVRDRAGEEITRIVSARPAVGIEIEDYLAKRGGA